MAATVALAWTRDPLAVAPVGVVAVLGFAVASSRRALVAVMAVVVAAVAAGALVLPGPRALATAAILAGCGLLAGPALARRGLAGPAACRDGWCARPRAGVVDEVTGLHNARGLMVLGEQALLAADRRGEPVGVLVVGAGLASPAGAPSASAGERDARLLLDVAAVLRGTLREADIVGRLSGPLFCALLVGAADHEPIRDRLARAVRDFNALPDRSYELRLSVADNRYDPRSPVPLDVLIEQAAGT